MIRGAKILVVDDDAAILRGVGGLLRDEGYRTVQAASTALAAPLLLEPTRDPPLLVLLDIRMPGETGLEFLARLPRPLPAPVVVLSGEASIADAVQALKLGATDFVEKPPSPERLLTAVKNALALGALSAEREELRRALAQPAQLLGPSAAMEALRTTITRIGPSDTVVLVTGETGSGKERVARALHVASGRRGRFVGINCAAIPAHLLESELFGYERGAFSGAVARHVGRIEQAQGGTLLLDELGDMPPELQGKLLRVLEEREIERLGGSGPIPIDVRFVAATHRDLRQAVEAGRFREDLYFRIAVFPLRVPPLRERPEDIVPLATAFAAELCGAARQISFTPDGEAALRRHPWPGNVRELRNVVERLILLSADGPLVVGRQVDDMLGPSRPTPAVPAAAGLPALGERSFRDLVEDFERALLHRALADSGGNVAGAARLLRSDRGNLYRRMKALGVEPVPDVESGGGAPPAAGPDES